MTLLFCFITLFSFGQVAEKVSDKWIDLDEDENYTARHECSFVQAGDKFIMFGGRESAQKLDIYDYNTNRWSTGGQAPKEFNHFQATFYKGFVWVIGSYKNNAFPHEAPEENIWLYHPPTETWIKGPEIPEKRRRGGAGLVVYEDKFYLVAGSTNGHDGGYVDYFDVYDPKANTWTELENAPRARDHFHAAIIGHTLYAAGGRLSGGEGGVFAPTIDIVDTYNFETKTWSSLEAKLPTPRAAAGTVVFHDELYLMGGEGELTGPAHNEVEVYKPKTGTWSKKANMIHPRHGTQSILSGNGIFIAAGSPIRGGGSQRNMEVYNENSPKGEALTSSDLILADNLAIAAGKTKKISIKNEGGNTGNFIISVTLTGKNKDKFNINTKLDLTLLDANEEREIEVAHLGEEQNESAELHVVYNGGNEKICTLLGSAWGYNDNRIALSFDGNSAPDNEYKWPYGDPDDWGACAASLAIIAKLNLQDKLVHCSYNNFIDAPAGPDNQNQNKISCDGAIERWNFDDSKFYDVTTELNDARQNLADEMAKSTSEDPLYFMHAGLSEFLYQAVKIVVDRGESDALKHVYLVSHSGFNETEIRRDYHHTWADVQTLCGNKINYKKIQDQNDKTNPNHLWSSGADFSVWYWMRDHSDANIQWLYSRMEAHSGNVADISDCGMIFYLLVGDDDGSPSKFENFIGTGIRMGDPVAVEGVNIVEDTVEIFTNRSAQLHYEVLPDTAWNNKVLWTTTDADITIVSKTGEVTAKSSGTANIIIRTDDGSFRDTTVVNVSDLPECEDLVYVAVQDFDILEVDGFVPAYKDNSRNAMAIDAASYPDKVAASQKAFTGATGFYNVTFTTLTEEDGESTFTFKVGGNEVGSFQNPEAIKDMDPYTYTFKNVLVYEGDMLQIESNAHSNGKVPEGEGFAYARGRWRQLDFTCANECLLTEIDGLLVFEAERFPLKGDWKISADETASGGQYIFFDGPNYYDAANLDQKISYSFTINNPGEYVVKWYMRQPPEFAGSDKSNDVWIYFSDDIGYGGNNQLKHYEKFYGRSNANFAFNGIAEVHDVGHKWLTVKFPSAGTYTLNLCGRSELLQIDRFVLYKGMSFEEAQLKAEQISETNTCGGGSSIFDPNEGFATYKETKIAFTDQALIIDGEEDEIWHGITSINGNFETSGKTLPTKTDFSFTAKLAWDYNYLYSFIQVKDNKKKVYSGDNAQYWNADNVEFYFNPDLKHNKEGAYGEDGIQMRMNYGLSDNTYSGNGAWKGEANHQGFMYASKDTDDGWIIEGQIPWDGLNDDLVRIEPNLKMGFDISLTDFDDELTQDHQIAWANDTKEGKEDSDTRKFGSLSLVKTFVPTPVRVIGVELTDTLIINPGIILRLKATVLPEDANNKTVTWQVIDPYILELVPSTGLAKGRYPGTTGLVVTTQEGDFTDTCIVIVPDPNATYVEDHEWVDQSNGEIILIPNPASVSFRVEGIKQWTEIRIFSITGKLILHHKQVNGDENISIEKLPSGLYLVRIHELENIHQRQLVIN